MRAKKSLGQHFLTSTRALEQIIEAARLEPDETVLEVGPGRGVLTEELLKYAKHLIAVEKDRFMIGPLTARYAKEIEDGQLRLVEGDILNTNLADLGFLDRNYAVVANIPYYITGELLRKLLSEQPQPNKMVLLVQKEVAERIARSKKESLLSLSVKCYGNPTYIATVPRGAFSPVPDVDSAILGVYDISRTFFESVDEALFFKILKLGFGKKRKQLLGNLSEIVPKETLTGVFLTLKLPLDVRAEDIALPLWGKLVSALRDLIHTG